MRAKWKSFCRQWRIDYEGQEINKENVAIALNSFIINASTTNNIKSGFKKTGIFPFDANSVGYTKIVQRLGVSTATDAPTTYLEQNLLNVTDYKIKMVDYNIAALTEQKQLVSV